MASCNVFVNVSIFLLPRSKRKGVFWIQHEQGKVKMSLLFIVGFFKAQKFAGQKNGNFFKCPVCTTDSIRNKFSN